MADQVKCYEDKLAEAQRANDKTIESFEMKIKGMTESYKIEAEQNEKESEKEVNTGAKRSCQGCIGQDYYRI